MGVRAFTDKDEFRKAVDEVASRSQGGKHVKIDSDGGTTTEGGDRDGNLQPVRGSGDHPPDATPSATSDGAVRGVRGSGRSEASPSATVSKAEVQEEEGQQEEGLTASWIPPDLRAFLDLDTDSPMTAVAEVKSRFDAQKRTIKEQLAMIDADLNDFLVEWMAAHPDEDLMVGKDRLYIGYAKRYKRRFYEVQWPDSPEKPRQYSVAEIANVLLAEFGEVALLDCLSSSALKVGALKNLSEDFFNDYFQTETIPCPKTGKPRKVARVAPPKHITSPNKETHRE